MVKGSVKNTHIMSHINPDPSDMYMQYNTLCSLCNANSYVLWFALLCSGIFMSSVKLCC